MKAVILVPYEGDHSKLFNIVAKTLKKKVYGEDASIVSAKLVTGPKGSSVTFYAVEGPAFKWDMKNSVGTFMTISHGGPEDGPILLPGSLAGQPWGSNAAKTALRKESETFWKYVGGVLTRKGGKVVLFGCKMGKANYARNVALAAGAPVYAATDEIAAADNDTAVNHMTTIEGGKVRAPMVKVGVSS